MKILIADDHALIRAGLRSELGALDPGVQFVEAWDAVSLRQVVDRHADLDLAIVDLTMPGMEREQSIAALREAHPALPLVVLSAADPVADARAVLRAGAAAFIPKSGMSTVMLQAIRLVLAGGQYVPPELMRILGMGATPAPPLGHATAGARADVVQAVQKQQAKPLDVLSVRQQQVFALLADGLPNKAIARRLGITEGTVKTHVATIFDVLNVHNRVSAVAAARALAGEVHAKTRDD